jgi:protein O-mannosyl-transferase
LKVQTSRNIKFYLAASIGLLTFLVYLPALHNEFVYWDDNLYIFENPYIHALDAAFFRWSFLDFQVSNWHPLTWISHAVDYALWGLNPLGHHLTGIILHAINTALVVLLVLKLLEIAREGSPASFLNDRTMLVAAGVTGLLFGIHPVHVESVAWVSERKDLLCALFFLLSIMAYVRYADDVSNTSQRADRIGSAPSSKRFAFCINKHYLLALGFFILALLSKPMAVTLPVILLILDWYPLNRIRSLKTLWAASIEKIPLFALSLFSSIITISAQSAGKAFQTIDFVPFSARAVVAAKSLVAYLVKMLVPTELLPFYPYPKDVSLFSFEYAMSIIIVIVITTACVMLAKQQKIWLSAWGYYVITLVPVLGIIQVGGQSMADRYTYLPSLGPFLIVGLCTAETVERALSRIKQGSIIRAGGVTIALLLVIVLSYLTIKQISAWRDSIALWTSVIEKGTEKVPMAFVNRGAAFQKRGRLDKAVADYEMAIDLDPSAFRAYISLSTAFEIMGRLDKALATVDKAIGLNPSSHEAYRNRGLLYEKTLQYDKAISDYTRAISLKPTYYEAYNNRGLTYANTGQFDKAVADYNATLLINPRHFGAYVNRGVAYTLMGHYDKALDDFNRALGLGQDDAIAYYNRGMFYRRAGKNELALADVRKACDLGNERACSVLRQVRQGTEPQ